MSTDTLNGAQSSALLAVVAEAFASFSSEDIHELIHESYAALKTEIQA